MPTDPPASPVAPEVEELSYQFFVMKRMIEQIPGKAGELLLGQFDKMLHALNARDTIFREKIGGLVEDAILGVKLTEFDLEVTRRERDEFKDRLS